MENNIDYIKTEKGSIYTYLEDGRTQRFKKVTGELNVPQDMIVFIPSYEFAEKNCPKEQLSILGENKTQYQQKLLSYIHNHGKKIHVVDKSGRQLEKNSELENTVGSIFLACGDENSVDFFLPVTREPRIGFMTYDTRLYKENGQRMREKHIGNKIVEIVKK